MGFTTRLAVIATLSVGLIIGSGSAAHADDKFDSLRALEALDQIMGSDCRDPLAYELRGDALTELGAQGEARRAYATATRLAAEGDAFFFKVHSEAASQQPASQQSASQPLAIGQEKNICQSFQAPQGNQQIELKP